MEVMSVGYEIPGYSEDSETIDSRRAISDVDLVLISTDIDTYSYGIKTYSNGDTSFNIESSRRLEDNINHWHKSILDHANAGDVIFIMLRSVKDFSLATGATTTKGKVTTYETNTRKNSDIIPVRLNDLGNLQGKNIVTNSASLNCFKIPKTLTEYIQYEVSFGYDDEITPVYLTKNRAKLVGGYKKIGKGYIVLLPSIYYDEEEFITANKKGEEIWTKDALKFGEVLVDFLKNIKKRLISEDSATLSPEWADDINYQTNIEKETISKVEKNNEKIEKLQSSNKKLQDIIKKEAILKGLLYETGAPLENSVIEGLKILGYSAENYNDGSLELDQVITSPEGERLIGECEGKDNKAINVTKFRQLNDSLAADFERDEVSNKAKGILFGNPMRLIDPKNRKDWFTEKAISGAVREGIALVKTPDLYKIVKYIKDSRDNNFASNCRSAIAGQAGVVKFPDIPVSGPDEARLGIPDGEHHV